MELAYPQAHVLFCDDVRQEVGNKPSLMGLYYDFMFAPSFPVSIPKLCVLINYIVQIDAERQDVTFLVHQPGDPDDQPSAKMEVPLAKMLAEATGKTAAGTDAKKLAVRGMLVFSPMTFKEAGALRVTAQTGDLSFEIGKIEIVLAPDPSSAGAPLST